MLVMALSDWDSGYFNLTSVGNYWDLDSGYDLLMQ